MPGKGFVVITADIVDSRKVQQFRKVRDQKLLPLSKRHLKENLLLSEYAITAWDEFQAILSRPEYLPKVIFDLRQHFYPLKLWIAVGIGEVSEPHRKPVNVYAGGPAFERARSAADELKNRSGKSRTLTRICSGNEVFDQVSNALYHLQDTLIQGVTLKQWETIGAYIETGSQEAAAKRLRVDSSTVSRNLRRGHYWEIDEAKHAMALFIESQL